MTLQLNEGRKLLGLLMLLHGLDFRLASTIDDARRRRNDGGRSQKLILFIRGNAISGAPIISGTSQFPKPPIIIGITMKKIITKAWAVTITL